MSTVLTEDEMDLICHLRNNSREKLTSLSRKTKMPVSTIHEKLKHNLNSTVKRYTVLLDYERLGYPIKAHTLIKVDKESKIGLIAELVKSRHVDNVFRTNNAYDLIIDAYFASLNESEEFFEKLENDFRIKRKDTHYILNEFKCNGFMTNRY